MSVFGPKLYEALDSRNIQSKELAARTQINPTIISKYISGERIPNFVHIKKIAEALDVCPSFFFGAKPRGKDQTSSRVMESGILIRSTLGDSGVNVYRCDITSDVHRYSLTNLAFISRNLSAVLHVEKSKVVMHYGNGCHTIYPDQFYTVQGYEESMTVLAPCRFTVFSNKELQL